MVAVVAKSVVRVGERNSNGGGGGNGGRRRSMYKAMKQIISLDDMCSFYSQ
jgi:hypothetical protein